MRGRTYDRSEESMPIEQSRLGEHIAAQMDAIEQDYADTDAELGTIITIVEVLSERRGSDLRMRPSDTRPHVILGTLRWVEASLLRQGQEQGGEEG
jgi:hypothetical protein